MMISRIFSVPVTIALSLALFLSVGCDPENDIPEIPEKTNEVSVNGGDSEPYTPGKLGELLDGKTVESLVWTCESRLTAADVVAIQENCKKTLKTADLSKVVFEDDGVSTYPAYTVDSKMIDPSELPERMFISFSELTGIVLPESVETIGHCALNGCKNLTSCTLPSRLKTMRRYAFANCPSLESLTLPETCTDIKDGETFENCTSLKSFTFPDAVVTIPFRCFGKCPSLEEIHFGKNSKMTTEGILTRNMKLKSFTLDPGNTNMKIVGDAIVSADDKYLLLQKTVCPDGHYVTSGAAQVTNLDFFDMELTSLEFGEGLIEINSYINSPKIETVIVPSTVTIFGAHLMNKTATLKCKATVPPKAPFLPEATIESIQVPAASVAAYKAHENWSSHAEIITGF